MLDTNVLIAAFISHGVCHELVEYCVLHHDVITSAFIQDEFQKTLIQKFKLSRTDAVKAGRLFSQRLSQVHPLKLDKSVCRDRDDDAISARPSRDIADASSPATRICFRYGVITP